MNRTAIALTAMLLSGCAGIERRADIRLYCRQAVEQGWCSAVCGRKQPAWCRPGKLIGGADPDACWQAIEYDDGSLGIIPSGECAVPKGAE